MRYIKIILFLAILLLSIFKLDKIMISEHRYFDGYEETYVQNKEGFDNLISNSLDVIFLGSSNIFLDVSPLDLYSKYGYKGYNLSTPLQTLQQSYFMLKYAFETQTPKIVFLDCLALTRYQENGESYAHMAYDLYPLDFYKIQYMNETLPKTFDRRSFQYPFFVYHTRYNELDISDFDNKLYEIKEDFLGYSPTFSVVSWNGEPQNSNQEIQIFSKAKQSLEQILELCNDKKCQLVLIKSPTWSWSQEESELMKSLALEYGIEFWEFNYLDFINKEIDFCDGGGHLNDNGAQKLTDEIGRKIVDYFGNDWIQLTDEEKDYFDTRVEVLKKCRMIENMKYEESYEEIIKKMKNEDYIILINAIGEDWVKNSINEITNNKYEVENIPNKVSIFFDNSDDMLKTFYEYDGRNGLEVSKYGHEFFLTFIEDKSIIQMEYYNYCSDRIGEIHIVVYDKFYDCVIDVITINCYDGNLYVGHV